MLLNLSDLSDESLQSQIIRLVRAKILAGDIDAYTSLPSIRNLARQNQVSVITVQRAYEGLIREGLIHSRRGKGFFVSDLHDRTKREMALERFLEKLDPLIDMAVDEGLSLEEVSQTILTYLREKESNGGKRV